MRLACLAAEVTRDSLDGAESSSSRSESGLIFPLIFGPVLSNTNMFAECSRPHSFS